MCLETLLICVFMIILWNILQGDTFYKPNPGAQGGGPPGSAHYALRILLRDTLKANADVEDCSVATQTPGEH